MLYPSKRGIKIAIYWKLFLELLVSHILLVLKLNGIKKSTSPKRKNGCILIEIMTFIIIVYLRQ